MAEAELPRESAFSGQDEHRLVRGLLDADRGAFAELYDRFAKRVHKFVTWRLRGDAQAAEDVVVQTLADVVRNIRRYDPSRASFLAWLLGIARRQTMSELRRRDRRRNVPDVMQVSLEALGDEALSHDPTNVLVARVEAQRLVARLRHALSAVEMEVLLLQGAHDLTAREIGQVLGKSERAINSLLHRARVKARERLASDEPKY